MLIGASWPWNLSTVPATRDRPAAAHARSMAPTCALYGATMTMSSTVTGWATPCRSIHCVPPATRSETIAAIACASSSESVVLPAWATGR